MKRGNLPFYSAFVYIFSVLGQYFSYKVHFQVSIMNPTIIQGIVECYTGVLAFVLLIWHVWSHCKPHFMLYSLMLFLITVWIMVCCLYISL